MICMKKLRHREVALLPKATQLGCGGAPPSVQSSRLWSLLLTLTSIHLFRRDDGPCHTLDYPQAALPSVPGGRRETQCFAWVTWPGGGSFLPSACPAGCRPRGGPGREALAPRLQPEFLARGCLLPQRLLKRRDVGSGLLEAMPVEGEARRRVQRAREMDGSCRSTPESSHPVNEPMSSIFSSSHVCFFLTHTF